MNRSQYFHEPVFAAVDTVQTSLAFPGWLVDGGFMPHGHCYLWQIKILIALISIATAVYLLRLRPKIPFIAKTFRPAEQRRLDLEALTKLLEQRIDERTIELKRAERKFRSTFDKAAVGMAHVSLSGEWLMVNPRLCDITGYTEAELLQKTFSDITHPEDLEKDWEQARALANGQIQFYEMEKRYLRKDGSVVWVKLSIALCPSEDGLPAYYISYVDDITAERAARDQAEIEKAKIINLFNQVPTPVAIYEGREHRIVMANPEYRARTGKEDLIGKCYDEAFPLAKEQGLIEILTSIFEKGQTWSAAEFPIRLDKPDGTADERYINATLQPYRDLAGRVAGLINISYDVTEQVRARHELEQSEQRLNFALKAADMGIWVWDVPSGSLHWDDQIKRLFGVTDGSFRNHIDDYLHRIHPDDRERVLSRVQEAVHNHKEFQEEYRALWPDTTSHWVLCRGGAVYDDSGRPLKLMGVALDISARKEAEEAIRSSEERFRTLFEQSPLSIEIHMPDGSLSKVNKAWMRLWNIPEEAVSAVMREYNVLTDPQLERKGIAEFIRRGFQGIVSKTPPTFYDPTEIGVEGRPRWIETHISPVKDKDGQIRAVVIVHEDISERMTAEEAIRRAKEAAEAANLAKTQFLANMSHEIRTPLGAMLGFAQLMLEDNQASEVQRNNLKTIVRNGEQLYRIIDELLDISKVEANKFEVEKTRFDLEELIRDVTSLLSVKAEQKGIEFQVSSEGPLPDSVCTDPTRFRQILINIIGNAIKFTEKGKVDVTFKLRDHEDGSCCLEVRVQDTGVGIPPEKIKKLFQPFAQADSATTRKFGGTGLGLYLSRKFAQALGGDIKLLERKEEVGCAFLILIDIGHLEKKPILNINSGHGEHVVKGSFKQAPMDSLTGVEVLVVDDSPDNLELTKRFLTAAGAQVETALGATKAFERLAQRAFDVIVMDIQMPEIDGYEAVRRLRKSGYEKPVVALTAHAMKGEHERCMEAGFDGYLIKPINRPALVKEIKTQAQKAKSDH